MCRALEITLFAVALVWTLAYLLCLFVWQGIPHLIDIYRGKGWRFYFWMFVHNAIVHPLLSLPIQLRCVQRFHDWTAERCPGGG